MKFWAEWRDATDRDTVVDVCHALIAPPDLVTQHLAAGSMDRLTLFARGSDPVGPGGAVPVPTGETDVWGSPLPDVIV